MTWSDELLRLNGADLYFEAHSLCGQNPPLLFLHGGPGYNSYSFQELFGDRLADQATIYLDQRGSGRSGSLADTDQGDQTLHLDTFVADVHALREHLGVQKLIPMGHGFGALIALEYARRYPEHTDRVIVVNPWVHYPELALTLLREASAARHQPLHDPAEQVKAQAKADEYPQIGSARVEAAFSLLNARDLLNRLHFLDHHSRMHLEFIDAQSQLTSSGEVQSALVMQGLWEFEYLPFLQHIRCPITVIAGVHDRTSYPEQVEWLADLAGASVIALDTGHYPWLDDEDAFAQALAEALTL